MRNKKLVGTVAFSAALAGGAVFGALFGTPTLSLAQEADAEAPTGSEDGATAEPERTRPAKGHGELATAAEVLGMTAEELRAELESGKSIADVAAEKGVDKQKVIDALVAEATAKLDARKAEIPTRVAEMVERDGLPRGPGGPGGPGGHRGPGGPGHHRQHVMINSIDDAATALGISRLELREALESGKSIAQIAEEKGVDLAKVKAAMVADATARIDAAVADGKLTAEQAATMKEKLAARIDAMVTKQGLPAKGERHAPPAEGDGEAATTSA